MSSPPQPTVPGTPVVQGTPIDPTATKPPKPGPKLTRVSLPSRLTWTWLSPLISSASDKGYLDPSELPDLDGSADDVVGSLAPRFEKMLRKYERQRGSASADGSARGAAAGSASGPARSRGSSSRADSSPASLSNLTKAIFVTFWRQILFIVFLTVAQFVLGMTVQIYLSEQVDTRLDASLSEEVF